MKKRILSIALTVALLISLIPLGAIPASAASDFKASQEMIDILKKWEGFSKYPYWDYSQWTVGYGTRAPSDKLAEYKKNGIPEDEAEALLQQFLESMGKSLNSFIDKYGLTMTQSQFDALLSLCYNCGTSWLFKPSTLRTSVIEGWTGDDLLFAFAQWSNSGDTTITGLIRRRLAEANMYLNGVYAVSAPADYCYVQFDANGGESEIVVQGYDKNVAPGIRAVPTYENYTFLGWYTDPTGGEKVTKLDKTLSGYTLYAHWKAGASSSGSQDTQITGTTVSYERMVATGTLNSFDQPVKGALVVDAYPNGEMVQIVAEYTDADGVVWGKVSGGGWINLSYTIDPNDDGAGAVDVTVTVTGNSVNLRRGPGTSYASVGQVDAGVELRITQTASGGGYLWGKSTRGWIALKYTNYDSVISGESKEEAPEQKPEEKPEQKPGNTTPDTGSNGGTASDVIATGKVVLQSGKLNVRSGPSTGYSVVGYLKNGDTVELLQKKTVGATVWGKTAKGWISLNYVKLDSQSATEPPQEPESSDTNTGSNAGSGTENNNTSSGSVTGKIVLQSGRLNIRSGPGTGYSVVGWLSAGDQVTITERKTVGGTTWGKISKGWISMNYVSVASDSNTGSTDNTNTGSSNSGNTGSADNSADSGKTLTGKVSADGSKLRVRTGPGSSYSIAGYLSDGSTVEILERKTVNGTTWGRIAKGWISLNYVKLDSASTGSSDSSTESGSTTGTVTADCLNVRAGAGTGYKIVARLYTGEKVTILETKEVNGTTWGRISSGWISMDYIK